MNAFLRLVAWILAVVLVALPVVAVIQGWIGADRWPLRTLRVVGDIERVDAARLRATVLPYAQRGFFAVRLQDAQRLLVVVALAAALQATEQVGQGGVDDQVGIVLLLRRAQ